MHIDVRNNVMKKEIKIMEKFNRENNTGLASMRETQASLK